MRRAHQVVVDVAANAVPMPPTFLSFRTGQLLRHCLRPIREATPQLPATAYRSTQPKDVSPTLSFDGTDPADAVFTISGLNGDEHGTVDLY